MDKRNQRRILTSLKEVVRCQASKEQCPIDRENSISYAASPASFPKFLSLAKEYYPSYLEEKMLAPADFTNVAKLTALEKSLKQQENSQTSALFDKLFSDPQAPLVLFMSTRYSGESNYQAAKIPIGFNSTGNKVTGLEPLVQSVRIDKEKNIVVILAEKGKIFDHELGDSGAVLGTAPNTMGFVAMSTVDGKGTTNLKELPTPTYKEPEKPNPEAYNPSVGQKSDDTPKKITKGDEPENWREYQNTTPERAPDYMKDPISPVRPVSSNDPDPTKLEDRGFYDPNKTTQTVASNDNTNSSSSRDSWSQASVLEADARVVPKAGATGKDSCH